jgi:hypothetical protein
MDEPPRKNRTSRQSKRQQGLAVARLAEAAGDPSVRFYGDRAERIAALSYLADGFELSGFKHFLWSFSSAGMADFAAYYGHETYFGLPSVLFVPLVAAAVAAAEYSILLVLLRKKRLS